MSDIHGDMKMFERAMRLIKAKSDAKVVAITGDLAGRVLEGDKRDLFAGLSKNLRELRNDFYNESNGKIATQRDVAEAILSGEIEFKDDSEKAKRFAKDYIELEKETKQGMRNQYETFKQGLEDLSQDKEIVLVPGHCDGKCIDDYLARFNIHSRHGKKVNVKGVNFVGYGGARVIPNDIPEEWLVHFNENEAYKHLVENTPEDGPCVTLLHTPVAGYEGDKSDVGSYALLAYMNLKQPDAILQGHTHVHDMYRDNRTGTMVVNPGNLGAYEDNEGGKLFELDVDEEAGWVKPSKFLTITGDHDCKMISFEKKSA